MEKEINGALIYLTTNHYYVKCVMPTLWPKNMFQLRVESKVRFIKAIWIYKSTIDRKS